MADDEASSTDLFVDLIERRPAIEALRQEPMGKRALAESIDVSEATAHRILSTFREAGVVERTSDGNTLTAFGRVVADSVDQYHESVDAAIRLEPLLSMIGPTDVRIKPELFADATITVTEPIDPYRPMNRFVDLLLDSSSKRGLDVVSVSPAYVEEVYDRIVDGMAIEVVYEPDVLDRLQAAYPDLAADAFERENLQLYLHDDLPFGLCLFDDRVGIGGYDPETGHLAIFVDTDDPDAYEWGERVFERYREEATAF